MFTRRPSFTSSLYRSMEANKHINKSIIFNLPLRQQFKEHCECRFWTRPGLTSRWWNNFESGIAVALLWHFQPFLHCHGDREIFTNTSGVDRIVFLQRERKKSVFEKYLCLYLWKQPQTDLQSETEMLSSHDQDGLNQVRFLQHS